MMGAKRTVYIPEQLNTELESFPGLNISKICQKALEGEVNSRKELVNPLEDLEILLERALVSLHNYVKNL